MCLCSNFRLDASGALARMQAIAMTEQRMCVICVEPLVDDVQALTCTHTFHSKCLLAFCEAEGVPLEEITCPSCRKSSEDVDKAKHDDGAPPLPENRQGRYADGGVILNLNVEESSRGSPAESAAAEGPTPPQSPEATVAVEEADPPVEATAVEADELFAGVEPFLGDEEFDAGNEDSRVAHGGVEESQVVLARSMSSVRNPRAMQGFAIEAFDAWAGPQGSQDTVLCCECNQACDPLKSRLMSKGLGKFRCSFCNTTHSQIYTGFGKGVEGKLATIEPDARQRFFFQSRGTGLKETMQKVEHTLERYNIADKHYAYGGTFKPKSVWVKLGYDGDILEQHSLPENVIPDRMWGQLYRIPELGIWDRGTEGKRSGETLSSSQPTKKRKCLSIADQQPERPAAINQDAPDEGAPEEDAEEDAEEVNAPVESSSSSTSSSSSSSSARSKPLTKKQKKKRKAQKKEKKKQKKEKKKMKKNAHAAKKAAERKKEEEKNAAKAAKVAEKNAEKAAKLAEKAAAKAEADSKKAEEKAAAQMKTLAKTQSNKFDKSIGAIEKALRSAGSSLVMDEQRRPLQNMLAQLNNYKDLCDRVNNDLPTPGGVEVPDNAEVKRMLECAKKLEAVYFLNTKAAMQAASLAV